MNGASSMGAKLVMFSVPATSASPSPTPLRENGSNSPLPPELGSHPFSEDNASFSPTVTVASITTADSSPAAIQRRENDFFSLVPTSRLRRLSQ